MEKKGDYNQQRVNDPTDRARLSETPNVYRLLNSYHQLPASEDTPLRESYHEAMRTVLQDAVATYATKMVDAKSRPHVSDYRIERINKDFDRIVQGAQKIDFPADTLADLSLTFIDQSLDFDTPRAPYERQAAAEIGLAVGGEKAIRRIAAHQVSAMKEIRSGNHTDSQVERAKLAYSMIRELDIDIEVQQIPSIADNIATFTHEHARSLATTGIVAVVGASILAPSVANATPSSGDVAPAVSVSSESQPSSIEVVSIPVVTENETAVAVAVPDNLDAKPESITVSGGASEAITKTAVNVAMPDSISTNKSASIPVQTASSTAKTTVSASAVLGPVETDKASSEHGSGTMTVISGDTTQSNTDRITAKIASPSSTIDPANIPKSLSVESSDTFATPSLYSVEKSKKMSPEQRAVATILDTLNEDGDVSTAASLIKLHFHSKTETETSFSNGKPIYETTNQDLAKNVYTLEAKVQDSIKAGAHASVDYVNTSLIALAVLDAAANDQTVLQSPEVQTMLTNVKRPDDAYQGKLFDQYLDEAKKTLEANDSALLKGVDAQFIPSIETMYAYSLMSAVSDAEQAKGIQAIKDAEAAAAAAAAAQTAPDQILEQAIDRAAAQFGWSNGQVVILKVAAQQGASAAAVAGLGGNVFAESGFDPAKTEYGSGIGLGYIQESYGRRTSMEQAAAAQGANVTDPTWQANYVVSESKQRSQRDNSDNEWAGFVTSNDPVAAADYWLYNNERAGVPHSETREAKATEIYNQINGQIAAIQAEQAAAAAAKAAAEAAEAAKTSNGQDILNYLNGNFSNGELPADQLTVVNSPHIDFDKGIDNGNSDYYNAINNHESGAFQLNPEAATHLYQLAEAYAAQFNTTLTIGAAYRSKAGQEDQKTFWTNQGKPGNAATPGHSNHGWGLAIDLTLAGGAKGAAEHQWLVANGAKYGWVWPNESGERWHFVYMGSAAQANDSDSPQPGLHQN